jgi:hypothetical protein
MTDGYKIPHRSRGGGYIKWQTHPQVGGLTDTEVTKDIVLFFISVKSFSMIELVTDVKPI